jgi:putative tryptophan/tyrosine transport system ATP-binding protein
MRSGQDIVQVEDLVVLYSRLEQTIRALDGIRLRVPAGEALIVTGQNGSGKSTLLGVLSGRVLPNGGTALIDGIPANKLTRASIPNTLFHVHQDPLAGSVATMTVFENLAVADEDARIQKLRRSALVPRYQAILEPLGLADRLGQQAQTLSPGQRQALTMIFARLRPAKLVLLDEPLAALDAKNTATCLNLIRGLKDQGKTLIYVTHHIEQTPTFGDRVVTLNAGRVVSDLATNQSPPWPQSATDTGDHATVTEPNSSR